MKYSGRITNLKLKNDPKLGQRVIATIEIPFQSAIGNNPQYHYLEIHAGKIQIIQDE